MLVLAGWAFLIAVPAKVHSCYVGQVNCGPAHDTGGRAADAAALTDEAHAIRVDELLGREPEGPTIAEQCRSATGSRRAGRSRSPSSVRSRRDGRARSQQARPMD